MPTEKQMKYIMFLLRKKGFQSRYMDASFKALGATMRERSGTVEAWVNSKNSTEASELIQILQEMPNE